jgi:hypothetical protein
MPCFSDFEAYIESIPESEDSNLQVSNDLLISETLLMSNSKMFRGIFWNSHTMIDLLYHDK